MPSARDKQLDTILDAIPFPVMYIRANGSVEFTNAAFRKATGMTEREAEGRHVENVLSSRERDNGAWAFMECLKGRRVSREGETATPGRPVRYCRYVYEPVRGEDGGVAGVCCTVVDLTHIKEAEQALTASHAELARSNADLEQFAYVASHDLKAPLRAIEVLVGWLSEDLAGFREGDVQENLIMLKQRTARLNQLLDDLLEYSRAGRRVGEQSLVNCEELVKDICTMLDVPRHFSVRTDGHLPMLSTHATPLEQVLRNLISNAIKHHPGPSGEVEVSAERRADAYVFSVRDDGAGIPEEYAQRVFEMFQTLKPRDEIEGSGMGLAIVRRIIEWQGGKVWFEPAPGGSGTVFKFEWNVDRPEQNRLRTSAA